jgi:hypothetical protein
VKILTPPVPQYYGYYGNAVSISGDIATVGAYKDPSAGTEAGAMYVYGRDVGGANNWGLIAQVVASDPAANDMFGSQLVISGSTILINAPGHHAASGTIGAVYVEALDRLSNTPATGAVNFGDVQSQTGIVLNEAITIANQGGDGSVVRLIGYIISGPDAGLFTLPDFSPAELTASPAAGQISSVSFSAEFLGAGLGASCRDPHPSDRFRASILFALGKGSGARRVFRGASARGRHCVQVASVGSFIPFSFLNTPRSPPRLVSLLLHLVQAIDQGQQAVSSTQGPGVKQIVQTSLEIGCSC